MKPHLSSHRVTSGRIVWQCRFAGQNYFGYTPQAAYMCMVKWHKAEART